MGFFCVIGVILLLMFLRHLDNPPDEGVKTHKDYDLPSEEYINKCPIEIPKTFMQTSEENRTENEFVNTKDLMLYNLRQMGFEPHELEDGGTRLIYQGEDFYMRFSGSFVEMWDLAWSRINVNDPNLPKLRDAINLANIQFGPTTILQVPDENGFVEICTRYDFLVHPALNNLPEYLRFVFNLFFRVKDDIRLNYNNLLLEEERHRASNKPQDNAPCSN